MAIFDYPAELGLAIFEAVAAAAEPIDVEAWLEVLRDPQLGSASRNPLARFLCRSGRKLHGRPPSLVLVEVVDARSLLLEVGHQLGGTCLE